MCRRIDPTKAKEILHTTKNKYVHYKLYTNTAADNNIIIELDERLN